MRKITLLVGVGIGYVLGAAAGRQRYDQIKSAAGKAWGNPTVQDTVGTAQRTAVQQAKSASTAVKDKLPGASNGSPTSQTAPPTSSGTPAAATSTSTPAPSTPPASSGPSTSPATSPTPTPSASSPASTGSTPGTTATTTPGTVTPPAKKP